MKVDYNPTDKLKKETQLTREIYERITIRRTQRRVSRVTRFCEDCGKQFEWRRLEETPGPAQKSTDIGRDSTNLQTKKAEK